MTDVTLVPWPALLMAYLFVFAGPTVMMLLGVLIYAPEGRGATIGSFLALWVTLSGAALLLAVTGFGGAVWVLWFATAIGSVVVLVQAIRRRRQLSAAKARHPLNAPPDGPLAW